MQKPGGGRLSSMVLSIVFGDFRSSSVGAKLAGASWFG
jgi:hypothetical protein